MKNSNSLMNRLPFLGVWELNKSVMLALGAVMVSLTGVFSWMVFMSATKSAWAFSDLNNFFIFSKALSVVLLWGIAHRVEFVQNLATRNISRFLGGAVVMLLMLMGTLEAFTNSTSADYALVVTMKNTAFALLAIGLFSWMIANRTKPVREVQNALSCMMLSAVFFAAARLSESLSLVLPEASLWCDLTVASFQSIGLILAFTGVVIYERFMYTLKQYQLSRHYIAGNERTVQDTLEWAMQSIGTPYSPKKPAKAAEAIGSDKKVNVTK